MDHFRNFFLNLRNGGNNMEDDEEEDLLSNEFESMDEEESDNRISFNKNLPSSHNYLSFDTPSKRRNNFKFPFSLFFFF